MQLVEQTVELEELGIVDIDCPERQSVVSEELVLERVQEQSCAAAELLEFVGHFVVAATESVVGFASRFRVVEVAWPG